MQPFRNGFLYLIYSRFDSKFIIYLKKRYFYFRNVSKFKYIEYCQISILFVYKSKQVNVKGGGALGIAYHTLYKK